MQLELAPRYHGFDKFFVFVCTKDPMAWGFHEGGILKVGEATERGTSTHPDRPPVLDKYTLY